MPPEEERATAKKGGPGCLALSILFLLGGGALLALFAVRAWRDVRVFTVWRPTTCTILDARIGSQRSSGRRSSGTPGSGYSYRPEITFRYVVDGVAYECTGWDAWALSGDYGGGSEKFYQRVLAGYEIGSTTPCWFDPDDPTQAVLARRVRAVYVVGLMPIALVVLGALGVWASLSRGPGSPSLPLPASAEDASGSGIGAPRRLAVRLEPESTPGQQSCGALAVALALLLVAALAGYGGWRSAQDGDVPLLLLAFVVLFGGLGLLFLWVTALAWLASRAPLPILEAAHHEAVAGEELEMLLIQPGPLLLRGLQVRVVCDELTPEEKSTPTVTPIHDEVVTEAGPAVVRRELPLEHAFALRTPVTARPSGEDGTAQVRWRLQVIRRAARMPRATVVFPLRVVAARPSAHGTEGA